MNSDLGIQRPVEAKDKGFGYHLGFETKIYHSNNPASVDGGPYKTSAGIWENALRNNFILGAYDLGGASFSQFLVSLTASTLTSETISLTLLTLIQLDSVLLVSSNFPMVGAFGQSLSFNADLNPRDGFEDNTVSSHPDLLSENPSP